MKNRMNWFIVTSAVFTMMAILSITANRNSTYAQEPGRAFPSAPRCTNGTAGGTYGYRMAGQIVGVGPFLVNGLFTHNTDGTMDGDVQVVIANNQIPGNWTGGTFKTNDDCTGSGKFFIATLNQTVTYNFIATDGGNQIELLNTDPGIVLHGVARRISKPGKAPSCNNGTVLGRYGYRLDGSLPNVPLAAVAGTVTHSLGNGVEGIITGADTASFMGQFAPRGITGTYKLNSNCRGTGFYTDTLGNMINYVFTAVDGGETLYLQGSDPGTAVSGVGRRIR